MRYSFAIVLLASATAGVAAAQGPTRALTRPEIEYAEPFTQISGVRELRDGRVIVADAREKVVQLIDLRTGSATAVGREGSGPGEYALPMRLHELPADSTMVFDPLNQRFLLIGADGKPGSFFSFNDGEGDGPPRLGPQGVRGIDRQGRLYFQTPNFSIGPDGPRSTDSSAIVRLDRKSRKMDTVAMIAVPRANTQVSGGGGNVQVRIGGANPYTPQNDWTVTADGRVAIVHASDYHVDYIAPNGARTSGPAIGFERIKVTEQDKKNLREQRARQTPIAIVREAGPGGRRTTAAPGGRALQLPEPTDWPEYKPPFAANSVVAAPNGQIWVLRHRPANDQIPTYDVIDARGQVVQRIALPKDTRLVGFGNGTIYLARNDEDDLQYLQRYKL